MAVSAASELYLPIILYCEPVGSVVMIEQPFIEVVEHDVKGFRESGVEKLTISAVAIKYFKFVKRDPQLAISSGERSRSRCLLERPVPHWL